MIFNSQFITLELVEVKKTVSTSTLRIRIKRNSQYYYNLEGLVIKVSSALTNFEKTLGWYTEYKYVDLGGGENNLKEFPDELEIDEADIQIVNQFLHEEEFTISKVIDDIVQRKGEQTFSVVIYENEGQTSEIVVSGTIKLTTLETALPTINDLDVKVESILGTRYLVTKTNAVNPHQLYTMTLGNSVYGTMSTFYSRLGDNVESRIEIDPEWEREVVETSMKYFLGNALVLEKSLNYKVPSTDLSMFYFIDQIARKIERVWQRLDGEWKEVSDSWVRWGGEFRTRE